MILVVPAVKPVSAPIVNARNARQRKLPVAHPTKDPHVVTLAHVVIRDHAVTLVLDPAVTKVPLLRRDHVVIRAHVVTSESRTKMDHPCDVNVQ